MTPHEVMRAAPQVRAGLQAGLPPPRAHKHRRARVQLRKQRSGRIGLHRRLGTQHRGHSVRPRRCALVPKRRERGAHRRRHAPRHGLRGGRLGGGGGVGSDGGAGTQAEAGPGNRPAGRGVLARAGVERDAAGGAAAGPLSVQCSGSGGLGGRVW